MKTKTANWFLCKVGKQGKIVRIVPFVTLVEPATKPEEYLFLVYDVRRLQRIYFDQGRKQDDLKAALAKESQLDAWNKGTRLYMDKRPNYEQMMTNMPQCERKLHYTFFVLVEAWRKVWHEYMAYKKQKDRDVAVEREIKKKCFDYEKAIDEYITKQIGIR